MINWEGGRTQPSHICWPRFRNTWMIRIWISWRTCFHGRRSFRKNAKSGLPRWNSLASSDAGKVEIQKTKNEKFSQEVPRFLLFFVCKGTGGLPVTKLLSHLDCYCSSCSGSWRFYYCTWSEKEKGQRLTFKWAMCPHTFICELAIYKLKKVWICDKIGQITILNPGGNRYNPGLRIHYSKMKRGKKMKKRLF